VRFPAASGTTTVLFHTCAGGAVASAENRITVPSGKSPVGEFTHDADCPLSRASRVITFLLSVNIPGKIGDIATPGKRQQELRFVVLLALLTLSAAVAADESFRIAGPAGPDIVRYLSTTKVDCLDSDRKDCTISSILSDAETFYGSSPATLRIMS
jgi:hypothetical protein